MRGRAVLLTSPSCEEPGGNEASKHRASSIDLEKLLAVGSCYCHVFGDHSYSATKRISVKQMDVGVVSYSRQ